MSYPGTSSALEAAFQRAKPIVEKHKKQVDSVSADITAVENFLRDEFVRVPFFFKCEGLTSATTNTGNVHELCWASDGKSFRLRYKIVPKSVDLNLVSASNLAEASLEERLKFQPYFVSFVDGMMKKLARFEQPDNKAGELVAAAAVGAAAAVLLSK